MVRRWAASETEADQKAGAPGSRTRIRGRGRHRNRRRPQARRNYLSPGRAVLDVFLPCPLTLLIA